MKGIFQYLCARHGIITGYTDNTFRPNKMVTREESIVITVRAMPLTGEYSSLSEEEVEEELAGFTDSEQFEGWSRADAAFVIRNGLLQGNGGKLRPKSFITGAEAAAVIFRMLKEAGLI